nr:hypothetical protein [Vibrio ziniensis]
MSNPTSIVLISRGTASLDSESPAPLKVEQNTVTLSDEGKKLLAALKDLEHEGTNNTKDKTVSDKLEAFTYGALGMEHPDKIKQEVDASYSAGQYLAAAASVGSMLLLFV